MDASPNIDQLVLDGLHLSALPDVTQKAFLKCITFQFFSTGGWYLAGGTALALQVGHCKSVDLDFFTTEKSFDEKKAEETLSPRNSNIQSNKTPAMSSKALSILRMPKMILPQKFTSK